MLDSRIKRLVQQVRSRLREQCIVDNLIKSVSVGMLLALSVVLIALFQPFYYAILVAAFLLAIAFVVGMVLGVRKSPSMTKVALLVDAKGYQEKISTALYLCGREDAFSVLQKQDALQSLEKFSVRREFPLKPSWKRMGVLLLLTILFVTCSILETPAKREAYVRHDVKKQAEEEIARLEKVERKLDTTDGLSDVEVAEVKEQLENAKKELRSVENHEELGKASERIDKKIEMASKAVKDETLGELLETVAKENAEYREQQEEELAEETKKALETAAKGSTADKKKAYEKLKEFADATGDSNLSEAAENYKNSNYSDSDYANVSKALKEASEQKQYAQNANNNTEKNKSQGTQQQGNGQGNQAGDGQKNGQGNGQSQNGQGVGQGNGNGTGSGWNYGGAKGREGVAKTNEDITVPEGTLGDDADLTGTANGNDSSTTAKSDETRAWSGEKVSYDSVSGEYKEKAYKKVNGSSYPGKLKDKIRNYFDGLD